MQTIYFDNAATSFPKSGNVFEAMKSAFFSCGNGGRGGHTLAVNAANTVFDCREALAALFDTAAENVVLTGSATLALNMAIKGLAEGKKTVLCSTFEHNAVLRPLYALAASGKIKLRFFTPSLESEDKTVAAFEKALAQGTELAVFTHAANTSGMCLPAKRLCALAAAYGAQTVVDCAQTAGHTPIDIKSMGADIICVAGHKGLGGPMGTGALIANSEKRLSLATVIEGGTGVASRDKNMPPLLPERLEAGTANVTGIAGLTAAVNALHFEEEKESRLRKKLINALKDMGKIRIYGADCNCPYMPLVLFNIESLPSDKAASLLAEKGICVRGGLHCAPLAHSALGSGHYGAVRVSIGKSNTEEELDLLIEAVRLIAKKI